MTGKRKYKLLVLLGISLTLCMSCQQSQSKEDEFQAVLDEVMTSHPEAKGIMVHVEMNKCVELKLLPFQLPFAGKWSKRLRRSNSFLTIKQ